MKREKEYEEKMKQLKEKRLFKEIQEEDEMHEIAEETHNRMAWSELNYQIELEKKRNQARSTLEKMDWVQDQYKTVRNSSMEHLLNKWYTKELEGRRKIANNQEEQEEKKTNLKNKHDKARSDFERHKQYTNRENRANLKGF